MLLPARLTCCTKPSDSARTIWRAWHPKLPTPNRKAKLIGPVGRRWNAPEGCKRALLVGGGVGAAPLFMLCQELVGSGVHVDVVLGAQTAGAPW